MVRKQQIRRRGAGAPPPPLLLAAALVLLLAPLVQGQVSCYDGCCLVDQFGVLSGCSGCGSGGTVSGDFNCRESDRGGQPTITAISPDTFTGLTVTGTVDFTDQLDLPTIATHAFRGGVFQGGITFTNAGVASIQPFAFEGAMMGPTSSSHCLNFGTSGVAIGMLSNAFTGATCSGTLGPPPARLGTLSEYAYFGGAFCTIDMGSGYQPTSLPRGLFENSTVSGQLRVDNSATVSIGDRVFAGITWSAGVCDSPASQEGIDIRLPLHTLGSEVFAGIDFTDSNGGLLEVRGQYLSVTPGLPSSGELVLPAGSFKGAVLDSGVELSSTCLNACTLVWVFAPLSMQGATLGNDGVNVLGGADSTKFNVGRLMPGALNGASLSKLDLSQFDNTQYTDGMFEGVVVDSECRVGSSLQTQSFYPGGNNSVEVFPGAFRGATFACSMELGDTSGFVFNSDSNTANDLITTTLHPGAFQGMAAPIPSLTIHAAHQLLAEPGSLGGLQAPSLTVSGGAAGTDATWLQPGLLQGAEVSDSLKLELAGDEPGGVGYTFDAAFWGDFVLPNNLILEVSDEQHISTLPSTFDLSGRTVAESVFLLAFNIDLSEGGGNFTGLTTAALRLDVTAPLAPADGALGNMNAPRLAVVTLENVPRPVEFCFPGTALDPTITASTVEIVSNILEVISLLDTVDGEGVATQCTCPTGQQLAVVDGQNICVPCAPGRYCEGGNTRSCPAGTFNDLSGATVIGDCLPCRSGTYNPFAGSTSSSCLLCAPGSASAAVGASDPASCELCAEGSFSLAPGQQECTLCAVGSYADSPGALVCTACPLGTYGVRTGGTNVTVGCQACPDGTSTAAVGATASSACVAANIAPADCLPGESPTVAGACTPCPLGQYCPDGLALPCPAGSFNNARGLVAASDCKPCPAGTFNELEGQTSVACVPCQPGTAVGTPGSTSSDACVPCPPGAVSINAGSSTCAACTQGTYAVGPGADSCTGCPENTYGSAPGQASLVAGCLSCPNGTDTAGVTAAASFTSCRVTPELPPVSCGAGQVRDPGDDQACLDVVCGPGLTAVGAGCIGCPAGTFGAHPTCTACPEGGVCPGGTVAAQVASQDLQASDAVLVAAAASSEEVVPDQTSSAVSKAVDSPTSIATTSIVSTTVGLALLLPLLVLAMSRCGKGCRTCIQAGDVFSLNHRYAHKQPLIREFTVLGVMCTSSMVVVMCGLAAGSILTFVTENTLVSTRFDPASGLVDADSVAGGWGLDLAVVVDGVTALADCPPSTPTLTFSGGGAAGATMGWGATSAPAAGGTAGDSTNLVCRYRAQCTDCALQSTLRAGMSLPAGAQSVAWALTVNRAVTEDTVGQRVRSVLNGNQGATGSQRLQSGTWSLTATREKLVDVRSGEEAEGYLLAFVDQGSTFLDSSTPVSGFVPQLTPVTLDIAVTLSPSSSVVTVSELQSVLGLLGSLAGLLGAVMAIWRLVYLQVERPLGALLVQSGILGKDDVWSGDHGAVDKPKPLAVVPSQEEGGAAKTAPVVESPQPPAPLAAAPPVDESGATAGEGEVPPGGAAE